MPGLKLPATLASGGRRTIGVETPASTSFFAFYFWQHLIASSSCEGRRTMELNIRLSNFMLNQNFLPYPVDEES